VIELSSHVSDPLVVRRSPLVWGAALALAVSSGWVAWLLADGPAGLVYLAIYTLLTTAGLPLGFLLFGSRHAAGWVAGATLGYIITAIAIWIGMTMRLDSAFGYGAIWAVCALLAWAAWRPSRPPLIALPRWTRRHTAALCLVLLLAPSLVVRPFEKNGEVDAAGNQYFRAYFTADFMWHMALTAELSRLRLPPRNPYVARERLQYYWTYFLLPAVVVAEAPESSGLTVGRSLELNAMATGMLFLAMLLVATWAFVPHIAAVVWATFIVVLAASAEGAYILWIIFHYGKPLSAVRELNIDAITLWHFSGLTIDGLPRALWYTPQHALALALSLLALMIVGRGGRDAPLPAVLLAGGALGGALLASPFLGAVFTLIYATALSVDLLRKDARPGTAAAEAAKTTTTDARGAEAGWGWPGWPVIGRHLLATVPLGAAAWACVEGDMIQQAGSALQVSLADLAENAPVLVLLLGLGPAIVPALLGLWPALRARAARPAVVGFAIGLGLLYFVHLGSTDPIWVGWRAGQVVLVVLPALAASGFLLLERVGGRAIASGIAALLLLIGLPTTVIDLYNAQDMTNTGRGPGYEWTVKLTPAQQRAFAWIQRWTQPQDIVQMDPTVRGRDTWSLIPSFAHRRMASGLPIWLLDMPAYAQRASEVSTIYTTTDAAAAWNTARAFGIDYVYIDGWERRSHDPAALAKFDHSQYFKAVFRSDEVAIYRVVEQAG
jgi:hypothetical protein